MSPSIRRRAAVFNHGKLAGYLDELNNGAFRFEYEPGYLADSTAAAVSLTLPKQGAAYQASTLFPFFAGLLAEGSSRELQARLLGIDEADSFGLLLAAGADVVGSVSIVQVEP